MGGPTIDMREVVVFEKVKDIARWRDGHSLNHEVQSEHMERMTKNI